MSKKTLKSESFVNGDIRQLSKYISLAESQDEKALNLLSDLYSHKKGATVIGLTGSPGAGKSTLLNYGIKFSLENKKRPAVLAVDPSSPKSGGAFLGDRVRLSKYFTHPDVFIRSLSSRGKLGGLSWATTQAIDLLDIFGFDPIFIETVGVGQSEMDIKSVSSIVCLILGPESGDPMQMLKSGVIEISDMIWVHKKDKEGAQRVYDSIKEYMEISGQTDFPIFLTSIKEEQSIQKAFEGLMKLAQTKKQEKDPFDIAYEIIQARFTKEFRGWLTKKIKNTTNPYLTIKKFFSVYKIKDFFPS